jgi:Pyruvate/2-oxoacid:ferredoxin oxidoreductase delta subunit
MIPTAIEANGWTIFGPHVRGRTCGACKFCCTAVPVQLHVEHKPAGVRCRHLRAKGCGIYATRPRPCAAWSCKWLIDDTTADIRRPDQAGYAIDPMLDTILAEGVPVEVVQIWCDPARRDAHRDPALRAWLEAVHARFGLLAIVRWGSGDGLILVPPAGSKEGTWLELGGQLHTEEAMRARLAEVGAVGVRDQLTGRAS